MHFRFLVDPVTVFLTKITNFWTIFRLDCRTLSSLTERNKQQLESTESS